MFPYKKIEVERGTFYFLMEIAEDNRFLIEFYTPGDIGSKIHPADCIDKENAVQLGNSGVYDCGYWSALSYLSTGEMIFEVPIDGELSQSILIYETPWNRWTTMKLMYFNEEEFIF